MDSPNQPSLPHLLLLPHPSALCRMLQLTYARVFIILKLSLPMSMPLLKFFLLPGMPFTQLPYGELLLILQNANSG